MAHTWKYALVLGFLGAAATAACTVSSGDDDVGFAGESGATTGGSSGTGGAKGGSGGTGGSAAGKGGTGGTGGTTGGSAGSGTSGTGGTGEAGAGGDTGGTGGSASGSGGTGGTGGTGVVDTTPTCDPLTGSHPYPDCEPSMSDDPDDECGPCIKTNCCEESKACYSTDPYNVCGWGGPSQDNADMGVYADIGEIGCYTTCLAKYVGENGVCDTDGIEACTTACVTEMCSGIAGSATSDLAGCMQEKCPSECFGADACG